jgi:hypothetical protein
MVNITTTVLDIIISTIFYLKYNVLEAGQRLTLSVESNSVSPEATDRIKSRRRCVLHKIPDDGRPQLSESNKTNLVVGPDTETNWPTDCPSQYI